MIRPGPKEGPRTFPAQRPAVGEDRGGRPPAPRVAAPASFPPMVGIDDPLTRFGKWPSKGNVAGPRPKIEPGMPTFNPFERRWIDDDGD